VSAHVQPGVQMTVSPRPRWQRALNQRIERIKRQQDLTQQYIHASAHARSDPAVASGSASCISVEAMRELVRFHSEHRLQQDHESIQVHGRLLLAQARLFSRCLLS
jgi:hypothetical protein